MALKSASDQCPAIVPAMARNSIFRTPMATPVAAVEIKRSTPRRLPRRGLPGFGPTPGYTPVCPSLLVLISLLAVVICGPGLGWGPFWGGVTPPTGGAALRPGFG